MARQEGITGGDGKTSPFGDGNGKPQHSPSKPRNFAAEPDPMPGSAVGPNTNGGACADSIPEGNGGRILTRDPGPVSKANHASGVTGVSKVPFKGLK